MTIVLACFLLRLTLLAGYLVTQVQAILQPVDLSLPPLIYLDFFNFLNLYYKMINSLHVVTPAPTIEMFLVHQHFQSNGMPLGDIIPLDSVCQVIQLIPKFSLKAPSEMVGDNCLHLPAGCEFYINSFADKETFHAVLNYQ